MTHPYKNQPDYTFWSRAVSRVKSQDVDPVVLTPYQLNKSDQIATAGSCFAQHIARHLRMNGFNYFVTEKLHPIIKSEVGLDYSYGEFSARFGNIYSARQLLQLFDRAFSNFIPKESFWKIGDSSWLDPLRPQIQPKGFRTLTELELDRVQHLTAVKKMFLELDVFIFTLGLTESWISNDDGTVYPICPGVVGGEFDSNKHKYVNFKVSEVVNDLDIFLNKLKVVNPKARVIITVSPVPLAATAENKHVLISSTYSKSVLRVACEEIQSMHKNVIYFPSYEIITGNFSRGAYFAEDLRSVTEAGVTHVMKLFLKYFGGQSAEGILKTQENINEGDFISEMEDLVKVNCDEIVLDQINDIK